MRKFKREHLDKSMLIDKYLYQCIKHPNYYERISCRYDKNIYLVRLTKVWLGNSTYEVRYLKYNPCLLKALVLYSLYQGNYTRKSIFNIQISTLVSILLPYKFQSKYNRFLGDYNSTYIIGVGEINQLVNNISVCELHRTIFLIYDIDEFILSLKDKHKVECKGTDIDTILLCYDERFRNCLYKYNNSDDSKRLCKLYFSYDNIHKIGSKFNSYDII